MEALKAKQYPRWYDLPVWIGGGAIALHTYTLASVAIFRESGAWLHGAEVAGIVAAAAMFGLFVVIFTKEHRATWAGFAGIAHGLLLAGVYFAKWADWLPVLVAGATLAITIPALLFGMTKIKESYAPGGHSQNEWLQWSERVGSLVDRSLEASRTALDKAGQAEDAVRTAQGQAADIADLRAQLAEMQAIVAALQAKEDARAKDAARKREERANKVAEKP